MKQVLQNLKSGETMLADVPVPGVTPKGLLIHTRASLISAGTERMMVEFGKAGWIGKARAQPDKVRQVLDKIRTDGLMPTLEAVFSKLDEPMPLGYSNAGVVVEVGRDVASFQPGDRVISNGHHAEVVSVPAMLAARIPDGVDDARAAFTVLASIGLHGVRLAQPTLGETVVVYGLGLIGLLTVQILQASGCRVVGVDLDPERLRLAEAFGATTVHGGAGGVAAAVTGLTDGRGADAVLITASARTDDIVHQAAEMSRKRGRIVLVGVVGLNLRRSDFYEKELTFQVSCSYGAGRYDESYEQRGRDYPLPYVRWTEQRNFEAVLDLMASGRLALDELITHRVPIQEAARAYALVQDDPSALGVVLTYGGEVARERSLAVRAARTSAGAGTATVALVGAGSFSKAVIGPALARTGARLKYVTARTGAASALHLARKYGFEQATTDLGQVLGDPEVDAVVVATQHDTHARLAVDAIRAGKHVFVEKPMALTPGEVGEVVSALAAKPDLQYVVGFNRRFSPHVVRMRDLLRGRGEPLAMHYAVNAGVIPPGAWVHDPQVGGGRIVGEGCHFVDVLRFLAGSDVLSVAAMQVDRGVAVKEDKMAILLSFADGSIGTVDYFGNGSKAYPKERMQVYSQGRVLEMQNFRVTTGYGFSGFTSFKTRRQDKGHRAELQAFVDRVAKGGGPLMPLGEIVNATLATFAATTSAREKRTVDLAEEYGDALAAGGPGAPTA